MRKFQTLKEDKFFKKTFNDGKSWHTPYMVCFYLQNENFSVGYIASKKVGNAVKRNRAKRRMRALFDKYELSLVSGIYIFIAKKSVTDEAYLKIKDAFLLSMKRLNTIKR